MKPKNDLERLVTEALSTTLKDARLRIGLTQVELSRRLGRTQSYVSKYELGQRGLSLTEATTIALALELPVLSVLQEWVERLNID